MTDQQHPITPPPELVQQWRDAWRCDLHGRVSQYMSTQAAHWGADQELEACCEWVAKCCPYFGDYPMPEEKLRAARRPKPPSLKEQALELINSNSSYLDDDAMSIIRCALEQLDD